MQWMCHMFFGESTMLTLIINRAHLNKHLLWQKLKNVMHCWQKHTKRQQETHFCCFERIFLSFPDIFILLHVFTIIDNFNSEWRVIYCFSYNAPMHPVGARMKRFPTLSHGRDYKIQLVNYLFPMLPECFWYWCSEKSRGPQSREADGRKKKERRTKGWIRVHSIRKQEKGSFFPASWCAGKVCESLFEVHRYARFRVQTERRLHEYCQRRGWLRFSVYYSFSDKWNNENHTHTHYSSCCCSFEGIQTHTAFISST